MLSISMLCNYAEYHYAKYCTLFLALLNVIVLINLMIQQTSFKKINLNLICICYAQHMICSTIMLSVIMTSVTFYSRLC